MGSGSDAIIAWLKWLRLDLYQRSGGAQGSIRWLAARTGYDRSKISRILVGHQDATLTELDRIAVALGSSVAHYYRRTETAS